MPALTDLSYKAARILFLMLRVMEEAAHYNYFSLVLGSGAWSSCMVTFTLLNKIWGDPNF